MALLFQSQNLHTSLWRYLRWAVRGSFWQQIVLLRTTSSHRAGRDPRRGGGAPRRWWRFLPPRHRRLISNWQRLSPGRRSPPSRLRPSRDEDGGEGTSAGDKTRWGGSFQGGPDTESQLPWGTRRPKWGDASGDVSYVTTSGIFF